MSKQLTRDEAIEAIRDVHRKHGVAESSAYAELVIYRLIALGMFTPVEPKTVEEQLASALNGVWGAPFSIIADIKAAGFKIVKE